MNPPQQNTESQPPAEGPSKASPVSVTADFELVDKKQLKLALTIKNDAPEDVFLLNRLWTLDEENLRQPDPELVYRFATKDTLRLLFGLAPLPRLATVTYRNWPEMTLVKSGKTYEAKTLLQLPLTEYNVYFSQSNEENTEPVPVAQAQVILQWMVASKSVRTKPSTFDPEGFELVSPESLKDLQILQSAPQKLQATVLRRTDDFSRLTLPGEKPEPLRLSQ